MIGSLDIIITKDDLPRSKAVVPVLFLLCVSVVYTAGFSCFKVFPCSLSSFFFIPFNTVITLPGEEGTSLYASRAFVLYVLVFVIFLFFLFVAG